MASLIRDGLINCLLGIVYSLADNNTLWMHATVGIDCGNRRINDYSIYMIIDRQIGITRHFSASITHESYFCIDTA